jgi:hypothetical protein
MISSRQIKNAASGRAAEVVGVIGGMTPIAT